MTAEDSGLRRNDGRGERQPPEPALPPSRSIPTRLVRQRHCPRRRAILHQIHGLIVPRLGPELRRLRQARLRAFQQQTDTRILRKIDRYYCET